MSRAKLLALVIIIGLAAPFAYAGWLKLYRGLLERDPPKITVTGERFHGVGVNPTSIRIALTDDGTGLDEAIIRVEQKGESREIFRKKFAGEEAQNIKYEFSGSSSQLDEGSAVLEIKAFDRSFWSNGSEMRLPIKVDYRKPKIEVLSSQHNAYVGGSQLVFYRAFDESLALSGVKVGGKIFEGFKASGIDPSITDQEIYVSIYAIENGEYPKNSPIKLIAIDSVGNTSTSSFYHKESVRRSQTTRIEVGDRFMRESVAQLFSQNQRIIQRLWEESTGEELTLDSRKGSDERLLEQFRLVNETLRRYNDDQIRSLLVDKYRFERYWQGKFIIPAGSVYHVFGQHLKYTFANKEIGTTNLPGYELRAAVGTPVRAANSGVVIFSDNLGIYGRTLAIDHGLGIVSIYSKLNSVSVAEGDRIVKDQQIAVVGDTGFSPYSHLYFELRVQGVPVDPNEFFDAGWVAGHIEGKIINLKKLLGIPIINPIN